MSNVMNFNVPGTDKIIDEDAAITVSSDRMEAYAVFTPANVNGKEITTAELKNRMHKIGVTHGFNDASLTETLTAREYGKKLLVASGKRPANGKDGYIRYVFDMKERSAAPKLLDDGRVDYRELSNFDSITAGTVLAEVMPPETGEDGVNIFGAPVPHKPGRPAQRIATGKNVAVSLDGRFLMSTSSGQIVIEKSRVSVSPVLTIPSDVGNETGSIRFDGTVIVRGGVRAGFLIQATEAVEVHGPVEGAQIIAGGDVKLLGGVQGNGKAIIIAGGDLFTRFAQNASLAASGNITSDLLMHCTVKCNGSLLLEGKTRLLVGGSCTAGTVIRAKEIGSSMATATELSVGNVPELLERYNRLRRSLAQKREDFTKITQIVETLMKLQQAQALPADKQEMLLKSLQTKVMIRSEIAALEESVAEAGAELHPDKGAIYVQDIMYTGVVVTIGNAKMSVQDEIHASSLRNREGRVVIGPL